MTGWVGGGVDVMVGGGVEPKESLIPARLQSFKGKNFLSVFYPHSHLKKCIWEKVKKTSRNLVGKGKGIGIDNDRQGGGAQDQRRHGMG
jgi:hypothetical protein